MSQAVFLFSGQENCLWKNDGTFRSEERKVQASRAKLVGRLREMVTDSTGL